MSKRLISVICLVAALFVVLTLTTFAAPKPVKFTLMAQYSSADEKVGVDYAIAEVKKEIPYVSFEIEPKPQDEGEIIKTRAAAGDLPDIIHLNPGTIEPLKNSGSLLALDKYVAKFKLKEKMSPSSYDTTLYYKDGHVYAFSYVAPTPVVWWYNKDLFAKNGIKVPTNYDELMTAVKAFNAKDIVPVATFAYQAWPIGAFFDSLVMRTNPDGQMALATGKAKASDPGYKAAIIKAEALIKAGIFQKGALNTQYDQARALFYSEKAAMLINGSWETPEAVTKFGDKVDIMSYYPTADAGKENVNKYAMAGGAECGGYGVSSKVKDKELAIRVAQILAEYQSKGAFIKQGQINVTYNTEKLTSEVQMPSITKKLLADWNKFVFKSTFEHSLPNVKFAAGFGEELQKLVAGESANDFITNTNKLIESSKQ